MRKPLNFVKAEKCNYILNPNSNPNRNEYNKSNMKLKLIQFLFFINLLFYFLLNY